MRNRYVIEAARLGLKHVVGRNIATGIAYTTPVLMFGTAGKIAYDIVNDIMQKNAAKQRTAQTVEPEALTVKATSLRQ